MSHIPPLPRLLKGPASPGPQKWFSRRHVSFSGVLELERRDQRDCRELVDQASLCGGGRADGWLCQGGGRVGSRDVEVRWRLRAARRAVREGCVLCSACFSGKGGGLGNFVSWCLPSPPFVLGLSKSMRTFEIQAAQPQRDRCTTHGDLIYDTNSSTAARFGVFAAAEVTTML